MINRLLSMGGFRCHSLTGYDPAMIHLPITAADLENLFRDSLPFQIALADYNGQFVHTMPRHALLQSFKELPFQPRRLQSKTPIPDAKTVFTDGSGKTHKAVTLWKNDTGQWEHSITFQPGSTQPVKLAAVVEAFCLFSQEPINIVSDSLYVTEIVERIEHSFLKSVTKIFLCY